MRKGLAGLAVAGALAVGAHAELLGVGVGAGMWMAEPSGTAMYSGNEFDLLDSAGLEGGSNGYLWAYFNHPVPMLPNVRLEMTNFASDGKAEEAIDFAGTTYAANVKTNLTLNQTDALFYWGLPIPIASINFGFGIKNVDGELSVGSDATELSFALPVAYVGFRLPIPGTPVGVEADFKTISYDKSGLTDLRAKVDWTLVSAGVALAIEAGYRTQSLKIEDLSGVDAEADITIDGLFAGLSARF